ncbi:unnamed protein product [Adineta ricciae]|uniref:Uncharacterized protein n=1 Tax=Adineta ricciae TaxID=249248 RepID=A0A813WBU0_ADIRI|nr:unnamed protein product [Adineta ricciae]CAF1120777.1 unnamed protein product [Adineta ricciae]
MVVDKTLYNVLGVEPSATQDEITRAARKKALEHHPDRGGSHEMMQQVNAARDILSDPEKRRAYDQYGLKGMQSRMENQDFHFSGFPNDIFDIFNLFDHGSTHRHTTRPTKGEDIKHVLQVTLEELYSGSTRVAVIDRSVVCETCQGTGSRDGITRRCTNCDGTGMETSIHRAGPFIQQTRRECSMCHGSGDMVDPKNRCRTCYGKKVNREEKILDVHIVPGSADCETVKFHGEGHQIPNGTPGTVFVILKQEPHNLFERKNDNLFMRMEINLTECLCGFQRVIKLLDNHEILIDHPAGKPILPNSYRCLKGYGMPNRNTHSCGDLIIQFDVKFPDETNFHLTDNQRLQLESILPAKKRIQLNSTRRYEKPEMNEYYMNREDFYHNHQEDDDADLHHRAHGVRCPQQ